MRTLLSAPLIREARGHVYRLHWRVRSQLVKFDLLDGLALLKESERWPAQKMQELRDKKLRALVARMWEVSPHYRRLMDEKAVRPSDIRGVADLPLLPIMDKATLREHAQTLRARDIPDSAVEWGVTGGTTGLPMNIPRDLAGTPWMRGSYWRGFGWGGLQLGMPWVQLFGGSLGHGGRRFNRVKNWFAGKVFLPAFELSGDNVGRYVDAIQQAGARFLVGYASACHQLAVFAEQAGLSLRLDAVFPTAELMPEQWGERIARVFGAKVLPYYGCGEIQSLGYSCPEAPGVYHTCDEHAVIEVEAPDGRTALEGEGPFLITDLDNSAFPMIRYRNGDAGKIAAPGCPCGRTLGRIVRVDGRINDVLVTTTGAAISGVIGTHAFRLVRGVDAFQIVQSRPGQVVIKIVRAPGGYDPAVEEPKLRKIFGKHLGEGADVAIEYPTSLPKTAAGKSRFMINEYLAGQPSKA